MGKRIRIALLTAAMLMANTALGAAGAGLGAAGEGLGDAGQAGPERWLLPQAAYAASAPSSGAISLKVNLVEGTDTAEVSLQVDGTVTGTVQSVAAALTYDTHCLTLIDWDEAKTPAVLGETPAAGRTMGRRRGGPWRRAGWRESLPWCFRRASADRLSLAERQGSRLAERRRLDRAERQGRPRLVCTSALRAKTASLWRRGRSW
ncbi:hypothetical protein [Bacilliculturomica massiliensis]|uniref:hypothetical protein n=1 Tax=Bacilliculturomica massiliensis TaxID=1917867 RepID=UPI001FE5DA6C|nr:hypothetical protein [Bacilliculturomica massiliensis]